MDNVASIVVEQLSQWGPKLVLAIGILLVFWLLAKIARKALNKLGERTGLNVHVISLFAKTMKATLVIVGLITALGTLGINVSALVAGLGLTGFALGFALKDTISNLLAGVLILIFSPFRVGDNIKIGGLEGAVISIDLRYTTLDKEHERILIPNSKLFTDPITVAKKIENVPE